MRRDEWSLLRGQGKCWIVICFFLCQVMFLSAEGLVNFDDREFLFSLEEQKKISIAGEEAGVKAGIECEIVSIGSLDAKKHLIKQWNDKESLNEETRILLIALKELEKGGEVLVIRGKKEENATRLQRDLKELLERSELGGESRLEVVLKFLKELPEQIEFARAESEAAAIPPKKPSLIERKFPKLYNFDIRKIRLAEMAWAGLGLLMVLLAFFFWRVRRPYRFPAYREQRRFGGRYSGGSPLVIDKSTVRKRSRR